MYLQAIGDECMIIDPVPCVSDWKEMARHIRVPSTENLPLPVSACKFLLSVPFGAFLDEDTLECHCFPHS